MPTASLQTVLNLCREFLETILCKPHFHASDALSLFRQVDILLAVNDHIIGKPCAGWHGGGAECQRIWYGYGWSYLHLGWFAVLAAEILRSNSIFPEKNNAILVPSSKLLADVIAKPTDLNCFIETYEPIFISDGGSTIGLGYHSSDTDGWFKLLVEREYSSQGHASLIVREILYNEQHVLTNVKLDSNSSNRILGQV